MSDKRRLNVPLTIVTDAHKYAEFHGMNISHRQMQRLLDRVAGDIIVWSHQPKVEFAKGYKGGIKKAGPRVRSKRSQ